jgi:hypothetical protein
MFMRRKLHSLPAAVGLMVALSASNPVRSEEAAVNWATPGNAVPCEAWEKNEVAEIWTATKPISINGKKMFALTLGRNAMQVGNTSVWQLVETACGPAKKG